jgi:hypothetical protein
MMSRAAALAVLALAGLGCTQETVTVDVRSLERSGRSSFVCLGAPQPGDAAALQLTACSRQTVATTADYSLPHLYALVTQTTRGEIAVIDLSSENEPVLDQDPGVPGASFLPIGAQPIDIVSTPGGTASFVTVAEIGREGIFALPSTMIRPTPDRPPPTLSSWPACKLGSAPGDLVIASDPLEGGLERATCDGPHDALPSGALSAEKLGRQKLIVTMPDRGEILVIDAQALLDRPPGSFDWCPVDRAVKLEVDLPAPAVPPAPPPGEACVNPEPPPASSQPIGAPRPSGLALSDDRLYVGDLDAPVVHVIDLPTPCEPVERAPLLATSIEQPERIVTTGRLAISRAPTPDFRRYLYAVDIADASAMIFDVSDGATQRTPLLRPHPEWNPFQPPDRIRFNAPIRDILVIERDVPVTDPQTGVAVTGIRCDPNPLLECPDESKPECDRETLYRTASSYDGGAGPLKLRGTFAFVLLTSGQIAIIDIDDLDGACRVPDFFSGIQGCPPLAQPAPPGATPDDIDGDGVPNGSDNCPYHGNADQADTKDADSPDGIGDRCDGENGGLESSNESSCNVVLPNAPRSANYVTTLDGSRNEPGLQILPLLYDRAGTALQPAPELPQMRAVIPVEPGAPPLAVSVGGELASITSEGLLEADGTRHVLVMNLEDPRAHVVDQAWTVTYEGGLPGFGDNAGRLQCVEACDGDATQKRWDLFDSAGVFCVRGVQSVAGVTEQLIAEGLDPAEAASQALLLADFVEIASELPEEVDAHWSDPSRGTCSYQVCNDEFSTVAAPGVGRELTIREAYQDHLVLERPAVGEPSADLSCCFGGTVSYRVRARGQWIAVSAGTGFLHHVIADPATGACRDSCDPLLARLNGRIRPAPPDAPVAADDPRAFRNPMFRLAIANGDIPPERDMQFRFVTQGSFEPLFINLAAGTADLQPQAIRFIPSTGEMAITDGSLEGLILVHPGTLDVSRRYF